MKTLSLVIFLCLGAIAASAASEAPPRVRELAETDFATLARDPVLIAAITAQNTKATPLAEVQAFDRRWLDTPGTADFMRPYLDSPAGQLLRAWRKQHPFVTEIIVMDHHGANVAITEKTSDFWQGDEAKFTAAFQGSGTVFIDRVKFDDSTQDYAVQVSVPVREAAGELIGVICLSVNLEAL